MAELIWPTDAVTHMWDQHQTTPAMAVEAFDDPDTVAFVPDPKSRTGKSSRYIRPVLRLELLARELHRPAHLPGRERPMTSPELNDLLSEARELENADSSDYIPVKGSRPNRDKAQTLTVRLTDDEMARLRSAATERGLPVSAIVRAAIAHELQDDDENSTRALMTALRDHHLAIVRTAK